ncbi:MAG: SagB/ThcOx family dehydrogenase [Prevotella sp.]|nr:SagB/ThcOx family dehydrogenase [Prevotella sp.]
MKKLITLAIALIMMGGSMQAQETIQLPQPNMKMLKMKLGDALKQRRSVRDYQAGKEITQEQLSTILWAAVGINDTKSGRLTTPTAVNMQDIKVYVCNDKGVWLFNAKENNLTKVTDTDLRPSMTARQQFVMDAPVTLLLVSDQSGRGRQNERYGAMDAGYVSQDIYLACAAMGLKTVARAMMDQDAVKKTLKLKDGVMPMLNHPIGYGK